MDDLNLFVRFEWSSACIIFDRRKIFLRIFYFSKKWLNYRDFHIFRLKHQIMHCKKYLTFLRFQLFKETCCVFRPENQTHACACIRMVENDEKHSKMMKTLPFQSCAREALVNFFMSFKYFSSFLTMQCMHKHVFTGQNTQWKLNKLF